MSLNPWQVDSIQEFYVLKCPECTFIHQEESSFQEHAVENHPLSADFFGKKTEEGSFKKPTNEKKRKISTVDNKGCSIESKPRKKPKIDDCNQKNESNDVLIAIKEEISGTRIDQEISEQILEKENDVKVENINDLKTLATVNQSNDALIDQEAILIPRNDHEKSKPMLENEKYLKLEKFNVRIPSETVNNIGPRTNQLSEIFQVPKVPEVSVHDTKRHKCLYCGEIFMRRKNLKNHITSVHEAPKPYHCPHCNASFENKEVLQSHVLSVIAPFKCSICDYGSTKKKNLKRHISTVHEGQKPFRCTICNEHFNQCESMKLHVASVHNSHIVTAYAYPEGNRKKKYKCSNCDANFTQSESLKKHEYEVHKLITQGICVPDGKKCPICNKAFSNRSILKLHITSVHERKTPHKCIHCSASFAQKQQMEEHVSDVHEKNKPLQCSMCDARFSGKNIENLKKHITSVHGAQKPIMCTICDHGST